MYVIIILLLNRFNLSSDCHLENIVEKCSFNMTGADFYALCSDAMLNAISRSISRINEGMRWLTLIELPKALCVKRLEMSHTIQAIIGNIGNYSIFKESRTL